MPSKRILIVEDEMLIALDIEQTLLELGHEVRIATTLKQALCAVAAGDVSLVILDYHLQDGNTARLADHLNNAGIPFIVCSGSTGLSQLGEAFAGAGFLPKPFSTDDLLGAVNKTAAELLH